MTKRHTPPGRKSKALVVVVKPFGPHHCARCFTSVNAENTKSRGASNTRIAMIESGSPSRSTLTAVSIVAILLVLDGTVFGILFGLGLKLPQIVVEAIEALLEKAAVVAKPVVDVLERLRLDPAGPPLRRAAARDETG